MPHEEWLRKLTKLNKARGNAPHKPLLLLVFLEMADRGEADWDGQSLTPELAFRFETFSCVVQHRRTQRLDIRMPFHHLKTQGFWSARTETGEPSKHRSVTRFIVFDPDFATACRDPEFRKVARRVLIATHFEPAERNALYSLVGLKVPADDEIALHAMFETPDDATQAGRTGRFRLDVVSAYDYTCALTGYRLSTVASGTIVDAAHIHQFAESLNNDPRNGMALSKNAHWLFDSGLWSVDDDFRILVAADEFTESSPCQKPLTEFAGEQLQLPANDQLWPDPRHLRWHRTNRFLGR